MLANDRLAAVRIQKRDYRRRQRRRPPKSQGGIRRLKIARKCPECKVKATVWSKNGRCWVCEMRRLVKG